MTEATSPSFGTVGGYRAVARHDSDADGVFNTEDACLTKAGPADRQGCPADAIVSVTLHVIDQAKSGACPGKAGSCFGPAVGARVEIFDRNKLNGLEFALRDGKTAEPTKNPDYDTYKNSLKARSPAPGPWRRLRLRDKRHRQLHCWRSGTGGLSRDRQVQRRGQRKDSLHGPAPVGRGLRRHQRGRHR